MAAVTDYGYTVARHAEGTTFVADRVYDALRSGQLVMMVWPLLLAGLCAAFAGEFVPYLVCVAAAGAVWGLVAALRQPRTVFTLAPDALICNGLRYRRQDICNLGVWEPDSVQVHGRNTLIMASEARLASAVLSESFAVVFDYAGTQVWLCTRLRQPQADAMASEILDWLES